MFLSGVFAGCWVLAQGAWGGAPAAASVRVRQTLRRLGQVGLWAGCALVLAGPSLAPALWQVRRGGRLGGPTAAEQGAFFNHPARLLGLVVPRVFDDDADVDPERPADPYRYVAVGTFTNLVSTNGITWMPGSLGTNHAYLSKVAFGNDVFVTVGNRPNFGRPQPIILRSTDGLAWTRATLPAPVPVDTELRGVTFVQGQFVAVGGEVPPLIYTSPDGLAWKQQTNFAGGLFSIASGNGRYVAVGLSRNDAVE